MRNYQLLRFLSERHQVTLLTCETAQDPSAKLELARVSSKAIYVPAPRIRKRQRQIGSLFSRESFHTGALRSRQLQRAVDRELATHAYDVVQIEQSTLSWLRVDPRGAVVVLDEHNIEYETLLRNAVLERSPLLKLYYRLEHHKHRREEVAAWRAASGCTVTSAREAGLLRAVVPGKPVAVVMNSVDTERFRPSDSPCDPNELVFTGLMSYRPNIDAVTHFVRSILPLIRRESPEAHFSIVGAGPAREVLALADEHVRVTGAVDDVRPFLARAAVVVVPIRAGGGTRFKVAEGLAMGRPVVATTVGAEGIGVRDGQELLLADDDAGFGRSVVRLLKDRELARSLGRDGRRFAEANLSWLSAGERLERFFEQLTLPEAAHLHAPVAAARIGAN